MTKIQKYGLRPPEFAEAVGSAKLAREMEEAGWIEPIIRRHKLTIYDAGDVAKCWTRILAGEMPTPAN